jgi:hypothetical protein
MTGGREVSPGMTGGGGVFVRNDVCVLIFVIPSQRWAGRASPASFLRCVGLAELLLRHSFAALDWPSSFCVIPSQRWTAGKGREGISKLRPFFIFNNAKDVVENYSAAADNIRPIEIPDLTIVRQE